MPSKSAKQRRFMAAAANNPDFARRAGIPQSVAKEYHAADKRAKMYEGGLAPMNRVEEGKGGLGGLGATVQAFQQGGQYEKPPKHTEREYGPFRTRHKGYSLVSPRRFGLGQRSRRAKGWLATDPQPKSKQERRARRKAQAKQARGAYGEDVLMNVKSAKKRRDLIRAGWIPYRDPGRKAKGAKGKEGKRYKYGLDKNTVFYPPTPAVTSFGGAEGLPRTIQRRDPMSYIAGGAEGGEVNMFYGGPTGRMKRMLEEKKKREADPNWQPWMELGTEPLSFNELRKRVGGGRFGAVKAVQRAKQLGWVPDKSGEGVDLKTTTWYPPEQTIAGDGEAAAPTRTPGYDPYYGRGPGTGRGPSTGGRRGRGGGRGRRGRNGDGEPPPPRVIPPGRPPGGDLVPPDQPPPDYTPPDPRAGRDTPYSQQLTAHRARVEDLLGMAEGGDVRSPAHYIPASREVGYAEGGDADGTSRADNPYPHGSARWKLWERKHGRDPNAPEPEPETPPVAQAEEEEDPGFLGRLFGRSERELEEMDQAMGGYIPASREVGYQIGGLAELREAAKLTRPMGGVPPRVEMQMGGMVPAARAGMRRMPLRPMARPPVMSTGLQKPMPGRMMVPPRPPRRGGMMRPPGVPADYAGPTGGPRIPPNMRGALQRAMMMNRPRRGIPGPAGAGGAPNRVGMQDQQGGLARALQRGTGRAPMSRRQGFYR